MQSSCKLFLGQFFQVTSSSKVFFQNFAMTDTVKDSVSIVTRTQWKARAARSPKQMAEPVTYVFIHHSAGSECKDVESGKTLVQNIQSDHMDGPKHWDDIAYSFMIGGDGTVYEGRGWGIEGAHTFGYNDKGYGLCFLGTFTTTLPTEKALTAAKLLIAQAVTDSHVKKDYQLKGHRQVKSTECPGTKLYNEIQTWPQFTQENPPTPKKPST